MGPLAIYSVSKYLLKFIINSIIVLYTLNAWETKILEIIEQLS